MKMGIVTWYGGNYGSTLQAYAIYTLVRNVGHAPIFLQFDPSGGWASKLNSQMKTLGPLRTFLRNATYVRGRISAYPHRAETAIRIKANESFVWNNFVVTKRRYTQQNYEESLEEADAFLCGSDQIWNPVCTHYSPFYWLSFVPENVPKIAYAPSVGVLRMNESDKKFVVSQINSFQDVSVRESATADMLNSLQGLNKRVETVVDPTLLLPKERWVELCDSSRVSEEREPYAFAYILKGNPEQRAFCTRLARSRGLKLVVYPYLQEVPQGKGARDWGDERIFGDDPADFLARIRGASLVITDSFHCTIFSILFHRDFYVLRKIFDIASQRTRIDEILSIAGLENRVLEDLTDFCAVESDFDAATTRLAARAQSSLRFLKSAIARAEQSLSE